MPSEAKDQFVSAMESGLAGLRERSQLRSCVQLEGINFCSNDYLGLAEDPRLKQAVLASVERAARIGGTGSRLLSGHDPAWNELEEEFATFAGTEAAVYFANGYAANLGLLSAVLDKDDLVFSDALNHASLIDGIRLSGARRVIYAHLKAGYHQLNSRDSAHRKKPNRPCRAPQTVGQDLRRSHSQNKQPLPFLRTSQTLPPIHSRRDRARRAVANPCRLSAQHVPLMPTPLASAADLPPNQDSHSNRN